MATDLLKNTASYWGFYIGSSQILCAISLLGITS